MSLLAPLYFFGALAIGLPILFHLIRRQPKGQVEFSSLMFLQPTPPRLTRRSRLDNWPLLLLRGLALLLLAAAFARPFLRSASLSEAELPGRRIVLVVDTSASMQRTGLWPQALGQADKVLADLLPNDRLAIVTFDRKPTTLLGFEESSRIPPPQLPATAAKRLRAVAPSWQRTEIGDAIRYAGDLAVTFESEETGIALAETPATEPAAMPRTSSRFSGPAQVILISDLQAGGRMESLQAYAWPKQLRLDVRRVSPSQRTNATAQLLASSPEENEENEESDTSDRVRVRVTNSADATQARFRIRWVSGQPPTETPSTADAAQSEPVELPVQVPPGQSRVVRMPLPVAGVTALELLDDDHAFDNQRYLVSPQPQALELLHIGVTANDPRDSLLYYLQRVPLGNPYRTVTIQSISPEKLLLVPDPRTTPLIVVDEGTSEEVAARLRQYVAAGGRLLSVMSTAESAGPLVATVNAIASSQLAVAEADLNDYAMLSRIDFKHALFEPMADPKFNDFTKIRFWSHRKVTGQDDAWRIVAQFDGGDPALIERPIGSGQLLLLAAGWQPRASQLALSTKFIPLVFSLFESGHVAGGAEQYVLGEPIAIEPSAAATIRGPAGTTVAFRTAADLEAIDQPGIYQFRDGDVSRTLAVNLDESESRTESLSPEELERFGAVLGQQVSAEQVRESQRQLRDQELEREQKLWQWLLIAALGLLGLETLLGTLASRRRDTATSDSAGASLGA